jgi:pimeloyl-ACP methyl ester carboxylesterase
MGVVLILLAVLAVAYAVGPRPRIPRLDPALPALPPGPLAAEAWLAAKEAALPLRPDNQARVVWAGAPGEKTPWSLVYLHGYSASWREGAPVVTDTARRYGANLLLTRLRSHGLETAEPLLDLDAQALWDDAKEALALGRILGGKVVLAATSSGAPLALQLAARHPDLVQGLVLYSANIRIRQPGSRLMTWPWGLQVAQVVKGGRYNHWDQGGEAARYWYQRQRLEGAVQLQALLDACVKPRDFAKVTCPVYAAVYYKDEAHRDPTIRVWAVRWMMGLLGTPEGLKRYQEFPLAQDHVIACDLMSKDWQGVRQGTWEFLEQSLGWRVL